MKKSINTAFLVFVIMLTLVACNEDVKPDNSSMSSVVDNTYEDMADNDTTYWDGFDFGPNLSYAEEYETLSDFGDNLNAAEAASITFVGIKKSGIIASYSEDIEYTMTLVDIADIEDEEAYIYRCDGGDYAGGFAYTYQNGDIYVQGQSGLWVTLARSNEFVDPADVNWWGEYNSINFVMGITNYDGETFIFNIEDEEPCTAVLDPDDPFTAYYGELVFIFDGEDTIDITGGEYAETYFRSQY